jgi:hypothetical protein
MSEAEFLNKMGKFKRELFELYLCSNEENKLKLLKGFPELKELEKEYRKARNS